MNKLKIKIGIIEAEKYNTWSEAFSRTVYQQIWTGRIKNQQIWRYLKDKISKFVVSDEQKRKKKAGEGWLEPKGSEKLSSAVECVLWVSRDESEKEAERLFG